MNFFSWVGLYNAYVAFGLQLETTWSSGRLNFCKQTLLNLLKRCVLCYLIIISLYLAFIYKKSIERTQNYDRLLPKQHRKESRSHYTRCST